MNNVHQEFAREAERRGLRVSCDQGSGRYQVESDAGSVLASLENLEKAIAGDGDMARIARFMDTVVASYAPRSYTAEGLLWVLEPNDYVEKPDVRVRISDEVDRVLVHLSSDRSSVTWISPQILDSLGLTADAAGEVAYQNLDRELAGAKLEFTQMDEVRLGFLSAQEPVKASLILAPGLKQKIQDVIGWPVLAVAPDRNFLYLWAMQHEAFVGRVGGVVVREYAKAAYPISTEVFALDDKGVRAIGAFPKKANQSPQRNAGSRPSSGDSPASETPSSLGPRG